MLFLTFMFSFLITDINFHKLHARVTKKVVTTLILDVLRAAHCTTNLRWGGIGLRFSNRVPWRGNRRGPNENDDGTEHLVVGFPVLHRLWNSSMSLSVTFEISTLRVNKENIINFWHWFMLWSISMTVFASLRTLKVWQIQHYEFSERLRFAF